jgi:hypothetical protein
MRVLQFDDERFTCAFSYGTRDDDVNFHESDMRTEPITMTDDTPLEVP